MEKDGEKHSLEVREVAEVISQHETHDENELSAPPEAVSQEGKPATTRPTPKMSMLRFILVTAAVMSSLFIVALDTQILGNAIPSITTEFRKLDDVAWYVSAYNLGQIAFQPTYGRLYASFPLKPVFCLAIGIFCIGSTICAAAPTSEVLVLGRFVQGLGTAGIFSGALVVTTFIVSKEKFPLYMSVTGSVFAAATVLGPTVGGALTQSSLTWRACFWINIPIAAFAVVFILFTFKEPERVSTKKSLREKLASLDPISAALLLASLTCLVLGLQWGGVSLPWTDSRVWGTILGFGLMLAVFVVRQIRLKEKAIIPMRILTQRTVAACCILLPGLSMGMCVLTNYVPMYLQAARGWSPGTSGLYLLALVIPDPLAAMVSGLGASLTGYTAPFIFTGCSLMAVAAGLLSTLSLDAGLGHIFGYEALAGIGFGLAIQLPLAAIQNSVAVEDVAIGSGLFIFFQGFGIVLAPSISQTIFLNSLTSRLRERLSGAEVDRIVALGAAKVSTTYLDADFLPFVQWAYNDSVRMTLFLCVASTALAAVSACAMQWKTFKTKPSDTESSHSASSK